MAAKTKDMFFLPGEGTDQQQREVEILNPKNLNLHDFSVADWMKFAWNFAEEVNFFDAENKLEGNWQDFFIEEAKIKSFLDGLEKDNSLTPHLTLFVCFLYLLEYSKKHFNQLTQKHLDFYYQEILKINKKAAVPDQVHVIFELAKNSLQEKIAQNTSLDAGKDSTGKKMNFITQEEIVVNKTSISQIKNVYHHSDEKTKCIKACTVANSLDGLGKALPETNPKWYPFGYAKPGYDNLFPELPDARIGFAISSPLLLLNEGVRTITLEIEFQKPIKFKTSFDQCFQIQISGEKKWLEPSSFKVDTKSKEKLLFEIILDNSVKPVSGYNQSVLGEHFTTNDPVLRFLPDITSAEGYAFVLSFSKQKLKNISLQVDVKEIKSVVAENDLGVLNPKKPFFPFGPIPLKGSKMKLMSSEIFDKNWTQLLVDFSWMNKPDSLAAQYFAYRTEFKTNLTKSSYKSGITEDSKATPPYKKDAANLIVKNDDYFQATVSIFSSGEWKETDKDFLIFNKDGGNGKSRLAISNNKFDTRGNGMVQIQLNQSFLHEMYPHIYAMAMLNEASTLIPKEPYTPVIESLELSYSAFEETNFNEKVPGKNTTAIQLFHEQPFGQNKVPASPANQASACLVPEYSLGGELYLGLKDVELRQQISFLFQISEGSENPETPGFTAEEKMEWSVLCSDKWMTLNSDYLISNQTDNFLKSGIVNLSIPAEATKTNTVLPSGLHWIRVRMNKKYDAVCQIIDIKTQAVSAEFKNQENELSHLNTGIQAKTISTLTERKQAVKTVTQPFSSFGGIPPETDSAYYQRVSERLRHKNRAITLWDYEHLILEQFPEIHQVRCLNHTSGNSFLSPGNVTIVVVPDILNRNVFDIYQPRVSRATLNKIQNYINQLNTLHVSAAVINPEYEEVEITLSVRFRTGFDENYYQKILQEDLTKLLSPWAFEKTIDLRFGTILHKSVIVSYIEKLNYIDYLTELKVKHKGEFKPVVSPSSPKAILVSAKKHWISIAPAGCKK
ncbi:MAG: baseplate J/gp47 family protein [Prolixibacteraceae bacterium]